MHVGRASRRSCMRWHDRGLGPGVRRSPRPSLLLRLRPLVRQAPRRPGPTRTTASSGACAPRPPACCNALALPDPVHAARAGARVPEQPLRAERRAAGAAGGALPVRAQLQRARAQRGRARVPAVRAAVPHHPGHPPLAARGRGRAGARAASGAARAQACPACVHTFVCMPAVRKGETAGGLGVQASRSDNDGATSACRALGCRACVT